MTNFGRISLLAIVTAVAIAVGGCASDGGDPPASSSQSTNSPAPTTTTPTPPSDSEVASEAASAVLRKYYDVRSQPLTLLDEVAISTELAAQKQLFKKEREQGLRQIGETRVVELSVQSVNLDNSDPKAGKVPTVQIDLCFDVSDVDVIDKGGKSVIVPGRPDTGWIQFLVSNYQWDTDPDGAWRVASSQDLKRAPCNAS